MRYVFNHCVACAKVEGVPDAELDRCGMGAPGEGCPSDGPADGCEAVWDLIFEDDGP